MAEQKHPEAGRIRITCADGITHGTVVEVADGAGGWTKVRGVIAVSWQAPGENTFTRAQLHIESPMVDVQVRDHAVEQQVMHRGGGVQSTPLWEAGPEKLKRAWDTDLEWLKRAWEGGPLQPMAPLELRPDFVSFAKEKDIADLPAPTMVPPVLGVDVGVRSDQSVAAQGRAGECKQITDIVCGPAVQAHVALVQGLLGEAVDKEATRRARGADLGPYGAERVSGTLDVRIQANDIRDHPELLKAIHAACTRAGFKGRTSESVVVDEATLEVGFGEPDPAPAAPEPERDTKPFDTALARALQKHRSL